MACPERGHRAWNVLCACAVCACFPSSPPSAQETAFVLEEATIAEIHAAFASGALTCQQLVTGYLARIEAYDDEGPALNAILTLNPRALETAAEMDARYAADASGVGPLHCVPMVIKDNFDTADLPTTGASVTLADSVPPDDAFTVRRLREAGGLVLAKSNLTELAHGGTTVSSLGGQTRNPYDLTRTPGGSSGGTGAAIAANFASIGTGSDTGQSIRSPASAGSLVGIRPTRGLVSRDGIIPFSTTQDAAGPITRTVEDAARMLDAMAGYDANDPITAFSLDKIPESYADSLDPDALAGARIGVLAEFFGTEPRHMEVNAVTEAALGQMASSGAVIVRISIPEIDELTRDLSVAILETKLAFNAYLADLGPEAPVRTLEEFIERGELPRMDSRRSGRGSASRGSIERPRIPGPTSPSRDASPGAHDRNGRASLGRDPLPAPASTRRADRRAAAGKKRRALERDRLPCNHAARRFLVADRLCATRGADRYRVAGTGLERAAADRARLRLRTGDAVPPPARHDAAARSITARALSTAKTRLRRCAHAKKVSGLFSLAGPKNKPDALILSGKLGKVVDDDGKPHKEDR